MTFYVAMCDLCGMQFEDEYDFARVDCMCLCPSCAVVTDAIRLTHDDVQAVALDVAEVPPYCPGVLIV